MFRVQAPVETSLRTTSMASLMLFGAWCRRNHPDMWQCVGPPNYIYWLQICGSMVEQYVMTKLPDRQLPLKRLMGPSGSKGRRIDPISKLDLLDKIENIATHRKTAVRANMDIVHNSVNTIDALDLAHCMLYHHNAKQVLSGNHAPKSKLARACASFFTTLRFTKSFASVLTSFLKLSQNFQLSLQ